MKNDFCFSIDETNRILTSELNTNTEHRLKIVQLEEEKLVINKELDCLRRELADKSTDLNNERTKLENLIRTEQVEIKRNKFLNLNHNFISLRV